MSDSCNVKIGLFQAREILNDKDKVLKTIENVMKDASTRGIQLIVFPELYASGYNISTEDMHSASEEVDGPFFCSISKLATEYKMAILYGYPELAQGPDQTPVYYNSSQFVDEDGKSIENYRKIHLWPGSEKEVFTAGDKVVMLDWHGIKIALVICYDVEFPELVRILSLKGANIVLTPTASSLKYLDVTKILIPARAMENYLYVSYVNFGGPEFGGLSMCCDPRGKILVSADTEETLLEFVLSPPFPRNKYLAHRRPELYKDLLLM